jgi:putative methyltransferase (TIGR04325 family)
MIPERRTIWEGVYDTFDQASGDSGVFEGSVWLGKVVDRADRAAELSHSANYVAPIAQSNDYVLPVVAALIADHARPIRILDFGGGLAASYLPMRAMLPQRSSIEFVVVENEAVCREGRKRFAASDAISFRTELPTGESFDIVHFGSSLHYVEAWDDLLRSVAAYDPHYLIFAELPAGDNIGFVTTQSYYGSRIPVRFWNAKEFVDFVASLGFDLLLKARYRGYWLGKDEELPTDNFEERYRLRYMCQFLFRRHGLVTTSL